MQINPYSKNIVFFDAEFSDFDLVKGEIISLAMVKMDGKSLYLELEHNGEVSPWVKKHVMPFLNKKKVSREEAIKQIWKFVGEDKPYMISHVNQFDAVFFYKFLGASGGKEKNPFCYIPIDFANLLFFTGQNPAHYFSRIEKIKEELGLDLKKYRKHHALDDAKKLREVYLKFVKNAEVMKKRGLI